MLSLPKMIKLIKWQSINQIELVFRYVPIIIKLKLEFDDAYKVFKQIWTMMKEKRPLYVLYQNQLIL